MVMSTISASEPPSVQWAQRLTKERINNQDEQAATRNDTTLRGQTIRSNDTRRGQDIRSSDAAAGRASRASKSGGRVTEGGVIQGLIDRGTPLTAGEQARVTKYTQGTSGRRPIPTTSAGPSAAFNDYLKANPSARASYDRKFGAGKAKQILGY